MHRGPVTPGRHPTAAIHPEAKVDPGAEIGPFCSIGPDVTIGPGTRLISHVVIDGCTTVGAGNVVYPFAVLGASPQDLKYKGERTQLVIGDENTIREGVTLNTGTAQDGGVTRMGSRNLLMAYVHLGHDCALGDQNILANAVMLAGHVVIGDHAILGGGCAAQQFVRIGSHAYIGGMSGIERDVPPFAIAIGSRPIALKGANIVGLRRRGMPAATISQINEAIKLWARPDVPRDQALLEIESQFGEVAEIQRFIGFIRESETGVVR